MGNGTDSDPFIVPHSFYHQTSSFSDSEIPLKHAEQVYLSIFGKSPHPSFRTKLTLVNITRLTLPPHASLDDSAAFFHALKNVVPDLKVDFPLSTPTVKGDPNSNPNAIPGGGSKGKPNSADPAVIASTRFNVEPLHKLAHDLLRPSVATQLVDVVLIDTLPAYNITDCSYMVHNPDLIALVNAMQNDKLRFRPSPESVPLSKADSTRPAISSHGLFSANLIRQIAPNARITLLQGLNAVGDGYMSGFMGLLNSELKWLIDSRKEEDGKAIILLNLSLVCHWPPEAVRAFGITLEELTDEFHEVLGPLLVGLFVPKEVNIRIIAAAGNDGRGHTADLPASLKKVIETVALNDQGLQADYSNDFDPEDQGNESSHMHTTGLAAFGGPLCSVFIDPLPGTLQSPQGNTTGYALWSGTSFATAIVSGALAFLCGAGFTLNQAHDLLKNSYPEVLRQQLP